MYGMSFRVFALASIGFLTAFSSEAQAQLDCRKIKSYKEYTAIYSDGNRVKIRKRDSDGNVGRVYNVKGKEINGKQLFGVLPIINENGLHEYENRIGEIIGYKEGDIFKTKYWMNGSKAIMGELEIYIHKIEKEKVFGCEFTKYVLLYEWKHGKSHSTNVREHFLELDTYYSMTYNIKDKNQKGFFKIDSIEDLK